MANPKLLGAITITSSNNTFGWDDGSARTADIPEGEYGSILEVLSALQTAMIAAGVLSITITCSSLGQVAITASGSWTWSAGTTDDDLETLLGLIGSETVAVGNTLLPARRHVAAFYSPVPVYYAGTRRTMARRVEPTDDADATVYGSTAVTKRRLLIFEPLSEPQVEPDEATTDDDGAGGTVNWSDVTLGDFWEYVSDKKFRFYDDGDDGTVASPGTEGTEYITCVREGRDIEPTPLGGDDLTWWRAEIPVLITGG